VNNETLAEKFGELSTPLVLDAALRLKIPFRIAPFGITPIIPGARAADPNYTFRRHLRKLGGAIEE
jgi:hypothetical protein